MGCNVYIKDKNYVRVVRKGMIVNQFVNEAVKTALDLLDQKAKENQ